MKKSELRSLIRSQKRAMTPEQIEKASRELGEKFAACSQYIEAKTVYGYMPYNQEVRTVPMLERALREGKQVAVSKIYGKTMKFILVTDLTQMVNNEWGIPEPVADGPVAEDPTALVLMPGLAFTAKGDRMGYGGGFYDQFLAAEPEHPTVALCYDFQLVDYIPTEAFDIPVDLVLTGETE